MFASSRSAEPGHSTGHKRRRIRARRSNEGQSSRLGPRSRSTDTYSVGKYLGQVSPVVEVTRDRFMLSVVDTVRTALSEQSEAMSRAGLTAQLFVDAIESRETQDEEVTIHYLRGFEFVDVAIAIVMKDGVPMVSEDE